jgi:dTDP-4-amino-4,6-dideoxygalactose transaminase
MYYLLLEGAAARDALIAGLRGRDVDAVFHYVPLHSSPAGRRFGRSAGTLEQTTRQSGRIIRLPLWAAMTDAVCDRVIAAVEPELNDVGRVGRRDADVALELAG